jgi:hypothetical protein
MREGVEKATQGQTFHGQLFSCVSETLLEVVQRMDNIVVDLKAKKKAQKGKD